MAEDKKSFIDRLSNFFNFRLIGGKNKRLEPVIQGKDEKGDKVYNKVGKKSYDRNLWDSITKNSLSGGGNVKDRFTRYDELLYMVSNESLISMVADLYADEVSQADSGLNPIEVHAKSNVVKNRIEELLKDWGVTQNHIRETAWKIVVFGDAFDIVVISDKGVEALVPQGIKSVVDRIEYDVSGLKQGKDSPYIRSNKGVASVVDSIVRNSTGIGDYRKYLFGFRLANGDVLPAWNMCHYRNFSSLSEFYPYGKSIFMYSLSPFRQLKTSQNLIAMARAMSFPKSKFEVKVSEDMSEVDVWEAVNNIRAEYNNLGYGLDLREEDGIGDELWMPEGVLKHEIMSSPIRVETIADMEYLRDNLITGTRVPKGYLLADNSSFGVSGKSLLQQFKPFGRAVYSIQTIILEQLIKVVKMHFLVTGEFDKEDTDFQLSMNFPVVEESRDRLSMKSDTMRLATDILNGVRDGLGISGALPPKVIKYVFKLVSFLDDGEVDKLISMSVDSLSTDEEDITSKVNKRLNKEMVIEAYYKSIKNLNIRETVLNGRHTMNSINRSKDDKFLFKMMKESGRE